MAFLSNKRIILSPVDISPELLKGEVKEKLEIIFKRKVVIEKTGLKIDDFYDPVREQYNSTEILKHFIFNHPAELEEKVCLIVPYDLFIPILTFVFGEAHMNGNYCIVSLFRLKEAFYGKECDEKLLKERLLKEIVHELGHTFGLTHCIDNKCVMFSSYSIEDTDKKSIFFCDSCFEKLDKNL
ncbi:archaemetzincin [Thermotomaculum hydrothermale]|uniref:Archaemetzincin n=1 Tax=Thermotomaculum hydrothermale TaxID=981385 RepID=A0A7R6SYN7_9BACT|nr:archaemetzincin family Zn-dependent metalloprotease [Thermotomaculum hydrothermale]BBB32025.1 archaemetzincin [Thermotomaculum hydrothermale]